MDKNDLKVLEELISQKLGTLVSEGIKNIFDDARTIVHDCERLKSSFNFITHAMREIRSAIKDDVGLHIAGVRVDLDKYPKTEKLENGQKKEVLSDKGKIEAICDALDIKLTQEQADFWKSGFHSFAHRKGLQKSKKVDEEFIAKVWEPFVIVLHKTLIGIEEAFAEYYKQVEKIAANPTKNNAGILRQKIPNNLHIWDHFFKSTEDIKWLKLLEEEGVFCEPVEIIEHKEEGSISFPYWPATDFLKKFAQNKALTEEELTLIENIINNIPKCENPSVGRQIIEIAIALPTKNSSNLIKKIKQIIDSQYFYTFPTDISALIVKLQKDGFHDQANEIIRHLAFDVRFDEFLSDRYAFSGNDMRLYYIDGIFKTIALSDSPYPETAIFDIFLNRLFGALNKAFENPELEGYRTKYWYKPFDEAERNGELLEVFTFVCAKSAALLMAKNENAAKYVISTLVEKNKLPQWDIIKRLIAHLLKLNSIEGYQELLQELSSELEDDEKLRELNAVNHGGWVAHKSPFNDEDLDKLSPTEIIKLILDYGGPDESFAGEEHSKRGLRESVERQVQKRPDDFIKTIDELKTLSNEDIVSIVYAISQIEGNEKISHIEDIIDFCYWFSSSRYKNSSETVRRNFAHSIKSILRKIYIPNSTPIAYDSKSWKILIEIMNDPMGSAILSSTRKDKFYNLASHAINTPSIQAFECLIDTYFVPGIKYTDLREAKDFENFKAFITDEIRKNDNPGFRWICGRYITSFLGLDEQWVKDDLQALLFDKSNNDAWQAFVAGLLNQRYVCNDIFKKHYKEVIDYTGEQLDDGEDTDDFSIEKGMARHMAFVYCNHENETVNNEDTITHKIFTKGSLSLRKALLRETQRFLKKDKGGNKSFEKIKILIEWRLQELRKRNFNPDEIKELEPFFLLFPELVKHDAEWSLEKLDEIMGLLKSNGRPHYPDFIIDALSEVDMKYSHLIAKCLNTWVKNLSKWFDERDVEALIVKINESDSSPETKKILRSTISILLARGHCRNTVNLL